MPDTTTVIHPTFHHFNLKTTRLAEMIDFYRTLVGAEVLFQNETSAWLSNDAANHRIAFLAFPGFSDDPEKEARTGIHHSAFEFASFEELNSSYLRLRALGIEPALSLDHGMTLSYYYKDPDGNYVEMQCDVFGDWAKSAEWMRTSETFHTNPIGVWVDPAKIAQAAAAGASFAEIHQRASAGELARTRAAGPAPDRGLNRCAWSPSSSTPARRPACSAARRSSPSPHWTPQHEPFASCLTRPPRSSANDSPPKPMKPTTASHWMRWRCSRRYPTRRRSSASGSTTAITPPRPTRRSPRRRCGLRSSQRRWSGPAIRSCCLPHTPTTSITKPSSPS